MRVRVAMVVLTCFILVGASSVLLAHTGHDHKVMGVITMVDDSHLMVKAKDGKEHHIQLTRETKILRGKRKAAVSDLQVDMRVVVNVGAGEEPLVAKEVTFTRVPAPKTASSR